MTLTKASERDSRHTAADPRGGWRTAPDRPPVATRARRAKTGSTPTGTNLKVIVSMCAAACASVDAVSTRSGGETSLDPTSNRKNEKRVLNVSNRRGNERSAGLNPLTETDAGGSTSHSAVTHWHHRNLPVCKWRRLPRLVDPVVKVLAIRFAAQVAASGAPKGIRGRRQ